MDRLIALVGLRFRIEWRALLGARERWLGLLVSLPLAMLFALGGAALGFVVTRALEARHPEALLALISVAATFIGLFWALSPLLSGVTLTEAHDLTRLVHFPVPTRVLVASSFVANFAQPMVLGELPMLLAVALALAGFGPALAPTLLGLLLSLAFIVAAAQAAGIALHGLSRNRRRHDQALFLGLSVMFLVSIGPFMLLSDTSGTLGSLARRVLGGVLPALSPFGWGARAAVHASRGELGAFVALAGASLLATVVVLGLASRLAERIHTGELDVGAGPRARDGRARVVLPGVVGTLVEKDLRIMWREPALRAMLVIGLAGPLVFAFFVTRLPGGRPYPESLLLLASFVGLGGLGSNAFGLERRALALLLSFPIERWRLLLAKNLAATALRLPGLATVALAGVLLAPARLLPAALVVVVATLALATAVDNFLSILFPVALPAPGRNAYGRAGGGARGLTGVLLNFAALLLVLALSAPFVFLAWLPTLLDRPWLGFVSLPLSLLGALAAYGLLLGWAAEVLTRREPELLERVLSES